MLFDAIQTRLGTLSKSEQKVALALLGDPAQAVRGNISALARSAQVSEPTVVRFCRSVGYDGWHEFKLKLAQSLALALPVAGARGAPAADGLAAGLVDQICSRSITTLLDLRANLRPAAIEGALELLARAARIEFHGQGGAGLVAAEAQYKFLRAGVPAAAYSDPALHGAAAALLGPGDALVAISGGDDDALLRSCQLARAGGADLIALAPSGSALAQLATLAIPIDLVSHDDPGGPGAARLACLVVIDVLALGLSLRRGPARRATTQAAQAAPGAGGPRLDSLIG
jgi:RpiR family transcriptional regulator, carbohydrate utilization regulator